MKFSYSLTGFPSLRNTLQAYPSRNIISSASKRNKCVFFQSLSSSPSKKFCPFHKKKTSVLTLLSKCDMFSSSRESWNFKSGPECFNSCTPPVVPYPSCPAYHPVLLTLSTLNLRFLLDISFPSSTASGPDSNSSRMLKSTCISIVTPFTHLFNLSLSQGHVPADWKTSFIVPIPKCSSNLDNPSNYRPISLLSILWKLKNMFTLSFTNFVANTTLSPLLN